MTEINYLGHVVSRNVAMDKSKNQAMMQWPILQTIKHFRGFLWLTRYYKQGYASLANPLTDLLKKDSFTWTSEVD